MPPPAKIAMSTAGDSSDWMIDVASGAVLDAAFNWLCKRRVDYADNADVWNVRFRWAEIKLQLQQDLLEGQYRFSPLRRVQAHGECIELWNALDALVLKALAIVLNRRLDFPRNCFHVPGKVGAAKRGAIAAVRHICSRLPSNQFVFRSDVKSYYASIDHAVLLAPARDPIDDRRVLNLVVQYLYRTVDGGKLSLHDGDGGDQLGLSALACDGSDLSGAVGSPDGGHWSYLRPLHG